MRLVDLEPVWIERRGRVVGIRFICPINDDTGPHRKGHQITVLFVNPVDGGIAHPDDPGCPGNNKGNRWSRYHSHHRLTVPPSTRIAGTVK